MGIGAGSYRGEVQICRYDIQILSMTLFLSFLKLSVVQIHVNVLPDPHRKDGGDSVLQV